MCQSRNIPWRMRPGESSAVAELGAGDWYCRGQHCYSAAGGNSNNAGLVKIDLFSA